MHLLCQREIRATNRWSKKKTETVSAGCNPPYGASCMARIIEVRWYHRGNRTIIETREHDRSWIQFADDLPIFGDGFEVHDCYHFLFAERFGWSPVLRRFFFKTDPTPNAPSRPILTEEALVLNEALTATSQHKASISWCQAMGQTVGLEVTDRKMQMVLDIGRREYRRLLRDIIEYGEAVAVYEIEPL